jgi:glycogen operon protein
MINGHWEDHEFTVPAGSASSWRRVVDTALPSPQDIVEPGKEPHLQNETYEVRARSIVVLQNGLAEMSPGKSGAAEKTK